MQRALGLAALAAVAAATNATAVPAADDSHPVWSPDASAIVYFSEREPRGLRVVRPDGSGDRPLPHLPAVREFAFSPDWFWIAFGVRDESSPMGQSLVVMRPDGSAVRRLSDTLPGRLPAWSPGGNRIAFVRIGVHVPDLWLVSPDGSGLTGMVNEADEPVWSSDGSRIAFVARSIAVPSRSDIAVVNADGTGRRTLTTAGEPDFRRLPRWSPDGSRIAFFRRDFLEVVDLAGSVVTTYLRAGEGNSLEWSPDGRSVVYSGSGVFRLDLADGTRSQISSFGVEAALSRDGSQVAFAGAGECKDRHGIYRIARSGRPVRITNDCRIFGTRRADVLSGTARFDIVFGLAGDDRLVAVDPGLVGDDLYGGPGADRLFGAGAPNVLRGGPGADRLEGGADDDTLIGGRGRDVLAGGSGSDRIHARDAERDRISCGPSRGGEPDVAVVDRLDRVAPDCESVSRRPGGS